MESFKDLRQFPLIKDASDEAKFTDLLRQIYRRHANVVPVMAKGVAELRRDLSKQAQLQELPEIHQFLDGFYLSRIGIRILIGKLVIPMHKLAFPSPASNQDLLMYLSSLLQASI